MQLDIYENSTANLLSPDDCRADRAKLTHSLPNTNVGTLERQRIYPQITGPLEMAVGDL